MTHSVPEIIRAKTNDIARHGNNARTAFTEGFTRAKAGKQNAEGQKELRVRGYCIAIARCRFICAFEKIKNLRATGR